MHKRDIFAGDMFKSPAGYRLIWDQAPDHERHKHCLVLTNEYIMGYV